MTTSAHSPPTAANDLRWYFTREAAGPLRSNYGNLIHRLSMLRANRDHEAYQDDDTFLEDAARAGGITRVLRALDPDTAEVLWKGFGAEWPDDIALLGDLSALAPLTAAAAEAHRVSGSTLKLTEWLTQLFRHATTPEEMETLGCIHRDAQTLRNRALTAYLNQRRRIGRHAQELPRPGVLFSVRAGAPGGHQPTTH